MGWSRDVGVLECGCMGDGEGGGWDHGGVGACAWVEMGVWRQGNVETVGVGVGGCEWEEGQVAMGRKRGGW